MATYRWADEVGVLARRIELTERHVFEVKFAEHQVERRHGVTSKDVVTTFQIGRMDSFKIWQYIDKVEAAGDLTVRFNYLKPSSVGERNILRVSIKPDSIYGAIAKKATDLYASGKTTSSPEIVAVRAEKDALRPDPISSGPYKIDKASITEAQLTMIKNTGGLFADKVNFDKVVIYQGETAQVTPLVLAGDVDYATHGFPLATDKAFGDAGIRVIRGPGYTALHRVPLGKGRSLPGQAPSSGGSRIRDHKDESAKVTYGESAKPQKFMAGFSDNLVPLWVSAATSKAEPYAFDVGKAAALMTAAGYARARTASTRRTERSSSSSFTSRRLRRLVQRRRPRAKTLNTFGIKIVRVARSAASSYPT